MPAEKKTETKLDPQHQEIDRTFKSLNQPIWIVTTAAAEARSGLTATWIHQASIDSENPTVLIGLAPNHFTCETLHRSGQCVIHLLHPDQSELVRRFARPSSRIHDKFDDLNDDQLDNRELPHQSIQIPWLSACHTAFHCERIHSFDAGDRDYFLCHISSVLKKSEGPFMREADFFSACTGDQIQNLKEDLLSDVQVQRPLLKAWIENLKKE